MLAYYDGFELWQKNLGDEAQKQKTERHCRVIEIDEMWHYLQKKKRKIWLWIAIDRDTREVLAWEVGSRGAKSLKRLLRKLSHVSCNYYATDKWKIYKKLLPKEKHLASKKETQAIESVNATVRHYLARFHRRTHCYTKSKAMLIASLTLFFSRDYILSIFW